MVSSPDTALTSDWYFFAFSTSKFVFYVEKKINLLDASLSHILPLTHTGHLETAAAGQANQEWCKDYSSSGDTSGKWVGFQWSCSDSLLPHIEQIFSASTVFLKPTVISARCSMLFKLSMNNYRWLHSTPLERCDDFVFANVSFLHIVNPHRCQVKTKEIHPETSWDSSQSH